MHRLAIDNDSSTNLLAEADYTADARYFEYTSAANPIGARVIPAIPARHFPASLHTQGPTAVIPLDISAELSCEGPATGPGLCAHFVRILAGEQAGLDPNATSLVLHVIEGDGEIVQGRDRMAFATGDFLALPGGAPVMLLARSTARLYYVNDAPLLTYLGVRSGAARFTPTRYPAARVQKELRQIAEDPRAGRRNRISLLLGNARFPQTRTVTHALWAMYGIVPPRSMQKPHRHQSIALDFVSACASGCYSVVGRAIDAEGQIVHPTRVNWEPGMVFVTPPGYWHAHFNESNHDAFVIPIQDAGLQTYLRALDIRFAP